MVPVLTSATTKLLIAWIYYLFHHKVAVGVGSIKSTSFTAGHSPTRTVKPKIVDSTSHSSRIVTQ